MSSQYPVLPLGAVLKRKRELNPGNRSLLSVNLPVGIVKRRDTYEGVRPASDMAKYQPVDPGDFVMNQLGKPHGALGVSTLTGIVSPAYFVATIDERVSPQYLHHVLRSKTYVSEYERRGKNLPPSQLDISWEAFTSIPLAIPPLETQEKIADYLDTETAKIDALIQKKKEEKIQLSHRFGCGLMELLKTPESETVRLANLISAPPQYGANSSGGYDASSGPRYIRITDISANGSLKNTKMKYLDKSEARPYLLSPGDILVARSGATSGKSFLVATHDVPAAFAGYLIRVCVDPNKILPDLVYAWMQTTDYWKQIGEGTIAATIENVNAEKYKSLRVPVPKPAAQPLVAKKIGELRRLHKTSQELIKKQLSLLSLRRQAVIHKGISSE